MKSSQRGAGAPRVDASRAGGRDVEDHGGRRGDGGDGGDDGGQSRERRGKGGIAAARSGAVPVRRLLRRAVEGVLRPGWAHRRNQARGGKGGARSRCGASGLGARGDRRAGAIRHWRRRGRRPHRAGSAALAAGADLSAQRRRHLLPRRGRFRLARRLGRCKGRAAARQRSSRHRAGDGAQGRGAASRKAEIGAARTWTACRRAGRPPGRGGAGLGLGPAVAGARKGPSAQGHQPGRLPSRVLRRHAVHAAPLRRGQARGGTRVSRRLAEGLGIRSDPPGRDCRSAACRFAETAGDWRSGRVHQIPGGAGARPGALPGGGARSFQPGPLEPHPGEPAAVRRGAADRRAGRLRLRPRRRGAQPHRQPRPHAARGAAGGGRSPHAVVLAAPSSPPEPRRRAAGSSVWRRCDRHRYGGRESNGRCRRGCRRAASPSGGASRVRGSQRRPTSTPW